MERMMREMVVCIVVALSVLTSAHRATAGYNSRSPIYGGIGQKSTHMVGRDGMCLDIGRPNIKPAYSPTILSPCETQKPTQQWNILDDKTIRYTDKYCLVPYNYGYEFKVVLRSCSEMKITDTKWIHKNDDTLVHANSGFVLTAKPDNSVIAAIDESKPCQSWEATEGLSPLVANIKWVEGACLEFIYGVPFLLMNECSKENRNQQWALYADSTIRHNDNRGYCLTSGGSPSSPVLLLKCEDKATQRWNMNGENLIYQPNTNLVMEVDQKSGGSYNLIINKPDGTSSQIWTIY